METKRTVLLENLNLISPALSNNNLIPILTHYWFSGKRVMAFNDQIAMSVPFETDFQGAVPGDTLLALLKASRAQNITLTAEDDVLTVKAARAKFKLALLPPEDFREIFVMPKPKGDTVFPVKAKDLLDALDCCLKSVSVDTAVPDQLGITLIPDDGIIKFYSTNNSTISRVDAKAKGQIPRRVVMPANFCSQLLKLVDQKNPKVNLEIEDDHCLFTDGQGLTMFGRLIEVERPYDFDGIIDHHLTKKVEKSIGPIPKHLRAVMDRALIIAGSAIDTTGTSITIRGDVLKCHSKSEKGEVSDVIQLEGHPDVTSRVEPKFIRNGCDRFTDIAFTDGCVIMVDKNKTYLVAAVGSS